MSRDWYDAPRAVYGCPPAQPPDDAELERIGRRIRQEVERRSALGKALFNLLAPLTGEDEIP